MPQEGQEYEIKNSFWSGIKRYFGKNTCGMKNINYFTTALCFFIHI